MGSLAQTLYPASLAWDGTTPAGGSIERLDDAAPASLAHSAVFGTGSGERIMNPVSNVTNGVVADVNKYGFALNYFGADGMDSVASAKRFINAGNWSFVGCIQGLLLTTQTFKVRIRIYRLSADALTRTLIGGPTDSASVNSNTTAVNWSVTINMPQVTFEAGETFMVAYGLVKNANSVTDENTNLFVGNAGATGGNGNTITLPSPGIRTVRTETHALTGKGTATPVTKTITPLAKTVTGRGTTTVARSLVAAVSRTVTGKGTVAKSLAIVPGATTVTGKGTVSGRIEMPIDEVPEGGGGTTVVKRPVFGIFD